MPVPQIIRRKDGISTAFNPKPTPARKKTFVSPLNHLDRSAWEPESGLDWAAPPRLNVGARSLCFKGGQWVMDKVVERSRLEDLMAQNKRLKEENKLLKVTVEVLLDMMTDMKLKSQCGEGERGAECDGTPESRTEAAS